MIIYMNIATRQVPFYEGTLRELFPDIPEELTGEDFPVPEGYARVKWVDTPEHDTETQYAIWAPPHFIDGEWCMRWWIRNYTPQQLEQIAIHRAKRSAEVAAELEQNKAQSPVVDAPEET